LQRLELLVEGVVVAARAVREATGCSPIAAYQVVNAVLTATAGVFVYLLGAQLGLRRAVSAACSLIGVSGCLYAVRRSAYVPIRADLISDFCIAMRMQEQGLRTVLDERAVCFEETLDQSRQELAMRVRVALRSVHALCSEARFLNPLRHGLFAWQLLSHKLLRYLSPLLWLLALVSNVLLAIGTAGTLRWLYSGLLAGQLLLLLAGVAGFWLRGLTKPHYFLLTNLASLLAWSRLLRGDRVVTWKPVR
jgi:hypothetical protein